MPAIPSDAIRVFSNQSTLLDTDFNIKRVSVAKPEIADVLVISPKQFLIVGKLQGTTSLVYWNEYEVPTSVEVIVGINVDRVREDLEKIAPDETFELTASGGSLILTGTVSSSLVERRLVESAKVYAQNPDANSDVVLEKFYERVMTDEFLAEAIHQGKVGVGAGVLIFSTGATVSTTAQKLLELRLRAEATPQATHAKEATPEATPILYNDIKRFDAGVAGVASLRT